MRAINRAGELLKTGEQVILFDCGGDAALLALSGLAARYGSTPVAVCDRNPQLCGKFFHGIPIQRPLDAAAKFPNAYWLISNFLDRAEQSHYLRQLGIAPDRIVNYQPYTIGKSCRYLKSYLRICHEKIDYCCYSPSRHPPYVDIEEDLDKCIVKGDRLRQETLDTLGYGSACDGCRYIRESAFPLNTKVELINYDGGGICNFRCVYCEAIAQKKAELQKDPDFCHAFQALRQRDILSEDVHIQFNAGEISVNPKRAEMFRAIAGSTASVLTNSSVFIPELAEKLALGDAVINTSMDAGTAKTFARIKGVNAWNRVCENLKRYAEICRTNIVLKYIFIPGLNDTLEEVDGFLSLCGELAGHVQISSDFRHPELVRQTTWDAYRDLRLGLDDMGILYHVSADAVFKQSE